MVSAFLTSQQAARAWEIYRGSLLRPTHCFVIVACAVGLLRGEPLVAPIFLPHLLSLCSTFSSSPRYQRVAAYASLFNSAYAILANALWAGGMLNVSAIAIKSWSSGLAYISHTLNTLTESIHSLTVLPALAVAALSLAQEMARYIGLRKHGVELSPALWSAYNLLLIAAPHLLLHYMGRVQQERRSGVKAGAGADTAAPADAIFSRGSAQEEAQPPAAVGTSQPDQQGRLEAKQREAEQDLAAIRGAKQQQQQQQGGGQVAPPRAGPQQQGGVTRGKVAGQAAPPMPRQQALQSLLTARKMVRHATASRPYTSRLTPSQVVVIKLADTEPEQLCSDVIRGTAEALRSAGYSLSVSGVCVRRGCVLLLVDLVSTEATSKGKCPPPDAAQLLANDPATLQAWLQTLVAAEADIPDGAVAHVLVGDQRLKATWQLTSRCWEIAAGPAVTAPQLSVVYADQPLVRLSGGASTGTHRLSLLLQAQTPPAALQFLGSDAHSVIPPATTSAPGVIYCTARGSWGGSLPVSVVAVEVGEHSAEEEEGGQGCDASSSITEDSTSPTHVLLMLDVDLATAPGPGAVQLELWAGLNILASAPLLLLPPCPSPANDQEADPLLEELRQHVSHLTWSEGTAAGPAAGAAALLSDLGQVLFTAGCMGTSPDREEACEEAWLEAVAASVRQHSAQDPALLSARLTMAEGLLEHAEAEGLVHLAHLVRASTQRISQHHQGGGPGEPHGQPGVMPPSWRDCLSASVTGFAPKAREQAYLAWAAQRCVPLLFGWKPWMVLWIAASIATSIRKGNSVSTTDLLVHVLFWTPHAMTLALAMLRRYRWFEAVVVYSSALRLAFLSACALNLATYPANYIASVRMHMDLIVDICLETPSQPLRLPALLLAHGLLMASVFVRAPLIPDQGLGAPVLGRLAALLLGLVLDARRRGRFMREQQPKLGQGLPGRDTGHVSGAGKATGTEAVDTPGEREEGNQGLRQQVGTSTSTLVRRRGGH